MITITEKDGASIIVVSEQRTDEEQHIVDMARAAITKITGSGWVSVGSKTTGGWKSSAPQAAPTETVPLVEDTLKAINDVREEHKSSDTSTSSDDEYPF